MGRVGLEIDYNIPSDHSDECVEDEAKDEEYLGNTDPEFGLSKETNREEVQSTDSDKTSRYQNSGMKRLPVLDNDVDSGELKADQRPLRDDILPKVSPHSIDVVIWITYVPSESHGKTLVDKSLGKRDETSVQR